MENKEELLKKIKALTERGVGGEKDSAQVLLDRLMKKYGVTESDLETERVETTWFRYRDEMERRILNQVIYMVTGKMPFGCIGRHTNRPRKERGVDCTAAERLEIETNYEFFKEAIRREFEVFFTAFCRKNGLYPSESKVPAKSADDLTPEEKARLFKASLMAEGMERHTLRKMIAGGNDDEN